MQETEDFDYASAALSADEQMRRECDRVLAYLVSEVRTLKHRVDVVEEEVQQQRDLKNRTLGMLVLASTVGPLLGGLIVYLAQRAFGL